MTVLCHSIGDIVRLPQNTYLMKETNKLVKFLKEQKFALITDIVEDQYGTIYEVAIDQEIWFVSPAETYSVS